MTFQFPEVAWIFSLTLVLQAHPQFRVMSVGKVFFSDFSPGQEKSEVRRQSESEGARQVELMDSGGGRVGRVLREQRRLVQAGLELSAPVLLLVRSPL